MMMMMMMMICLVDVSINVKCHHFFIASIVGKPWKTMENLWADGICDTLDVDKSKYNGMRSKKGSG